MNPAFVLCMLLAGSSWAKFAIVFPQSQKGEWKDVPPNYRYCPSSADQNWHGDLLGVNIRAKIPKAHKAIKADGWMCHAAKWITTCDYRWYGPQYITHSIHSFVPTQAQCEESIKQTKEGVWINPGFPPKNCGYASISDAESVIVQATAHTVMIDEYSGDWLDSQFPTGRCKETICETIHNSTLWYADYKVTGLCDSALVSTEVTFYSEDGLVTSIGRQNTGYRSNYFPYEKGAAACRMKYCTYDGIRLPSGVWFEMVDKELLDSAQMPECQAGLTISAPTQTSVDVSLILDVERMLDYSLCQETWSKVHNGQPISPVDLGYIAPKNPGAGPAFTIINGTLKYFDTRYLRIDIDGPVLKKMAGKISGTLTERELWTEWFPYEDVEIGPNGVLKTPEGYKFPLYMIGHGLLDADLQKTSQAEVFHHPQIAEAIKKLPDDETLFFGETGISKNPVELIEGWFSNWRSSVMAVVFAIALLVVLVLIVRIIVAFRHSCCRRQRKIYDDLEMNQLRK
nr:glycoprotein [Vesicular stomatitis virus]